MSKRDRRQRTMFLDKRRVEIRVNDIVRMPVTGNTELHGQWAEHRVRLVPGGFAFGYIRSENGAMLPPDYTGGYMADSLADEDERDLKALVFATRPLPVEGWEITGRYDPRNPPTDWEDDVRARREARRAGR
jgi:hypothetical protein